MLLTRTIYKAWPSLLSQTPHFCHNGLRGTCLCADRNISPLNPLRWLWSRAWRRSNFLSSYWSARWTEGVVAIDQTGEMTSSLPVTQRGRHKLKPQRAKHTSNPLISQNVPPHRHDVQRWWRPTPSSSVGQEFKGLEGQGSNLVPSNQHPFTLYTKMNVLYTEIRLSKGEGPSSLWGMVLMDMLSVLQEWPQRTPPFLGGKRWSERISLPLADKSIDKWPRYSLTPPTTGPPPCTTPLCVCVHVCVCLPAKNSSPSFLIQSCRCVRAEALAWLTQAVTSQHFLALCERF